MRCWISLTTSLLLATILGCPQAPSQPSGNPAGHEGASNDAPARTASDSPESPKSEVDSQGPNEDKDPQVDVDVGGGGVHIDAQGRHEQSGVQVDVTPGGTVDVDVGKASSPTEKAPSP
jgi:hypothetical protein